MPTLYNGSDGCSTTNHAGGPSDNNKGVKTIEVLLYNMASMLAGVAVGYDVRLSNVSPIHPKLYPKRLENFQFHEKLLFFFPNEKKMIHDNFFRSEEETEEDSTRFMYGEHSRSTGPPLYPHNTYHGYNHHQRTPLAQANFKPLKFTDSPMNNYNSTGHNSIVDGENVSQDDEVCTLYISHPFGIMHPTT